MFGRQWLFFMCGLRSSPSLQQYIAVFLGVNVAHLGIFLRRWWGIRGRLRRNWNINMSDGVSQVDFLRILFTTATVIIFYLPIAIISFALQVFAETNDGINWRTPYSWELVHSPRWGIIEMVEQDTVPWINWSGTIAAISLFALMGLTTTTRQIFEHCIEYMYDRSPSILRSSWMATISAKCKRTRLAAMGDIELDA
jgi:hypothetical protein